LKYDSFFSHAQNYSKAGFYANRSVKRIFSANKKHIIFRVDNPMINKNDKTNSKGKLSA